MTTYQYQGKGESLPGIPARNLTERDVARLNDEQLALLKTKGSDGKQLYVKRSDTSKKQDDAKPDSDE